MYDNNPKVGKLNYFEFYAVYELKVDSNKFKCVLEALKQPICHRIRESICKHTFEIGLLLKIYKEISQFSNDYQYDIFKGQKI